MYFASLAREGSDRRRCVVSFQRPTLDVIAVVVALSDSSFVTSPKVNSIVFVRVRASPLLRPTHLRPSERDPSTTTLLFLLLFLFYSPAFLTSFAL